MLMSDSEPTEHEAVPAPEDRLIVALDLPSADEALAFVNRLEGTCKWFKVGLELYCAAGNGVVSSLRERGFEVFLDLKLHDIPNTVAGAVHSVCGRGASLLTVHAGGGETMMRAASAAARGTDAPTLLAVTVLTSMDGTQLAGVGVRDTPAEQVMRLGELARSSGINGLVCSAEEVLELRKALGPDALLVVPGIRPRGAGAGDQQRIATPAEALERGASMLVVGRPITQATDPAAAAEAILSDMASAGPIYRT